MKQRKLDRLLLAAARADVGRWILPGRGYPEDTTPCLLAGSFVTATEGYVLGLARMGGFPLPMPDPGPAGHAGRCFLGPAYRSPAPEAYMAALAKLRAELGAP